MTKAKNDLPQEKGGEGEAAEKKAETPPNGAEKNVQNDAGGNQDADAGQNAPAADDGKGGESSPSYSFSPEYLDCLADALFDKIGMQQVQQPDKLLADVVMSIAVIETIKHIAVDAVRDALPQMLAEVEVRRQADAERAAKERQDAELAEQRKAEQEQRNRDRRQQREEQKAREKAAEARATEQEMSTEFYQKVAQSDVERDEIVDRVKNATDFLVLFGDGKTFNIDLKLRVVKSDLKFEGGSAFLRAHINVDQAIPTATVSECWLLPVLQEGHCATGLRCDLGSGIAIGGGRPVSFPAESIAWRC